MINMEYILKEKDFIVSETDLKGVITYVNEDLLRISGFDKDELMGAPNNIVHHLDMPVEVLSDLWGSLKMNCVWTGMVKKRCKNGNYYWVVEDATPIHENGKCVAYMSMCSKPSREDVEVHEHLYSQLRNANAGSFCVKNGKVVKFKWWEKSSFLINTDIKFRMLAAVSAMALMVIAIGQSCLHS